ncbi:TPA: hypothetical protein R4Y39_000458 [Raoultella planticola]|nr:hypothetical protein [Raoultella planticola]
MNNENELTALALTIEKCREIVGCPAGVDLQDWVTQLAAENVALKQAAEFATTSDMWIEQADGMLDYRYHEWYVDVLKTAMETPATSAYLAVIKADGVEEFVSNTTHKVFDESDAVSELAYLSLANAYVKQLREASK